MIALKLIEADSLVTTTVPLLVHCLYFLSCDLRVINLLTPRKTLIDTEARDPSVS